jgi:EAL and modified HD-GYP domain-containing signal transduction protein
MLYMARQPILDMQEQTFGYELLYRASAEARTNTVDANTASHHVLEQTVLSGCRELSGGKRLFINFTGELLVKDYVSVLPPDGIVVEILESVEPTEEVLEACRRLAKAGFIIALDDFQPTERSLPFVPFADIIKIDFLSTTQEQRAEIIDRHCRHAQILAEKVETRKDFQSALKAGFKLFQGHFFCRPVLLANQQLMPLRIHHLRLIEQACVPQLDFSRMEAVIKEDAALCYRLLRYLNSYAFCLRTRITSIRQALALLGEHQIKKWVAVACVSFAAAGASPSALSTALLRAHVAEALAAKAKCRPYDLFIVGLFSMMDTFLSIPLQRILSQVSLPPECSAALLGERNKVREVLDLVIAYERADWSSTLNSCPPLNLDAQDLISSYVRALQAVDNILGLNLDGTVEFPDPCVHVAHGGGNGLRPM